MSYIAWIASNFDMKKIFLVACLFSLVSWSARAEMPVPSKAEFSYLFHLYYDHGQLFADRDFEFKYDVIGAPYESASAGQFPYRGELINFAGEVADHFVFDPRGGDVHFVKGKLSIKAPYVADGQRAVFYDFQNRVLLTVPVSESSFCNDDGICNDDRGEDSLSCPKDCKQAVPVPPVKEPTTGGGGGSNGIVLSLLYLFAGIGLLGGGWWFLRRRKSAQQSLNMPQMPTPPLPPDRPNTLQ